MAISEGTVIDGVHCTPDSVELLPRQPDVSRPRLRIVVCFIMLSSNAPRLSLIHSTSMFRWHSDIT